jgi:hypothetical protein
MREVQVFKHQALAFGGITTVNTTATEEYDGTSWSNTTSMSTARRGMGNAGTQTSALGFGGFTTTQVANTEEYTGAFLTNNVQTITTS